jgi:hypothetical protein
LKPRNTIKGIYHVFYEPDRRVDAYKCTAGHIRVMVLLNGVPRKTSDCTSTLTGQEGMKEGRDKLTKTQVFGPRGDRRNAPVEIRKTYWLWSRRKGYKKGRTTGPSRSETRSRSGRIRSCRGATNKRKACIKTGGGVSILARRQGN